MGRTRGNSTWHGRISWPGLAPGRAIANVGWPAMLLAAGIALAAAAALVREKSLLAFERPVRHRAAASNQVQSPPPMPLILNFDLRP